MKIYNLTLVFKPNSNKDEVVKEITDALAEAGGKILSKEELATKKLAYPVKKSFDGDFYRVVVEAIPTFPATMTETLRISDHLLRFLITSDESKTVIKEVKEETK